MFNRLQCSVASLFSGRFVQWQVHLGESAVPMSMMLDCDLLLNHTGCTCKSVTASWFRFCMFTAIFFKKHQTSRLFLRKMSRLSPSRHQKSRGKSGLSDHGRPS